MNGKLLQNDQCNLLKLTISRNIDMLIIALITIFIKLYSDHANMVQNEGTQYSYLCVFIPYTILCSCSPEPL